MYAMMQYPDCPYCGNSSLSVVDVEIDGLTLKGIRCNSTDCQKYVGFFKDDSKQIEELYDKIEELEGKISDIEDR